MNSRNRTLRKSVRGASSRRSAVGLALASLIACGGDSTAPDGGSGNEGQIPGALASDWRASPDCAPRGCRFFLYWEQTADTTDLLEPPFHSDLDLILRSNGSATLEFWTAMTGRTTVTGTAWVEGSRLLLRHGDVVDTLTYSISGNLLDLRFHQEVDLGFREPAAARAVLERR